ncbi:hypothetical protein NESM_000771400 [Novymonas esmeraldas]|uniref:Uncharacterized protein n=1 Tax=Novymonas esmeraldas TaxID=1808958 RepID=A0AAW0EVI5_9TRYP
MSWVRVECTGGHRYAAPSHGRPTPRLEGLARLFQPPYNLRQLHTTCTLMDAAPAVSSWGHGGALDADECVDARVVVDQRDMGGHLGVTTVAVGDEAEDVAEGDDTSDAVTQGALHQLLDNVFTVLSNTNERGVQLLLDALCTRSPAPLTSWASAEATVVKEDDGGRRVPPELWLARAHGARDGAVDAAASVSGAPSNRHFLQRITHGGCGGDVVDAAGTAVPLSLLPLQRSAVSDAADAPVVDAVSAECGVVAVGSAGAAAAVVGREPLSYAAALRRRSFLYFVPQQVVPLSMLAIRLEVAAAATAQQRAASVTAGHPAQQLRTVLLRVCNRVVSGLSRASGGGGSGGGDGSGAPRLRCISHLREPKRKLLSKNCSWAAVACMAEDAGRVLVWAVARLLAGSERVVRPGQSARVEQLLLHDLWAVENTSGAAVPLVAAYSPSGLLTASARFLRCLSHDEQLLLSAAAVDRLTRYARPHHSPGASSGGGVGAASAEALRWTSWRMRLCASTDHLAPGADATTTAGAVVDVLLITVGDALAIYFLFPQEGHTASSAPPSASLRAVQTLLSSAVAEEGRTRDGARAAAAARPTDAIAFASTHSTAPYSPAFHDALFTVTALEEALSSAADGGATQQSAAPSTPPGARGAAPVAPTTALPTAPQSSTTGGTANAVGAAAAAAQRRRSVMRDVWHTIISCLPVRREDAIKSVALSRRPRCITAAQQQQTSAYVHQLTHDAASPSLAPASPPESSIEAAEVSDPYATALVAMPLVDMLCYAAALVTRNELGTLRFSYELGLHSLFFLQRPPPPPSSSSSSPAKTRTAASPTTHRHAAPPTQFGISFARYRLQQSPPPTAVVPDEWLDGTGAPRGSGSGRLLFFEDPTLLLRLSVVGAAESRARSLADTAAAVHPTQVSVVPTWALLQAVPPEVGAGADGSDTDTVEGDADSDGAVDSGETWGMDDGAAPAAAEDAQLVTSIRYRCPQRLRRHGAAATMSAVKAASATKEWCEVEAVVSVCGDVTGTRQDVLAKALLRHALSSAAAETVLDPETGGGGAAVPADSLLPEWTSAVVAPHKMVDLCREVVWFQEAALTLLAGVSSLT